MKLASMTFDRTRGWSEDTFPDLDSERTLVLAFGAACYMDEPEPLRVLARAFPRAVLAGCSTSGEIHGTVVQDDTLVVAIASFEHTTLRRATTEVASPRDSYGAGVLLARQLEGADLASVLVFSDGLGVNGSELVRGLNAVLAGTTVVTGGLAGDGDRFARTWVLRGDRPATGFVTAVGLYGDRVRVGHGSKGGWDIFGPERVVTRSEGNVLHELDGRPALQLYKSYLGERAAGLPATGLLFPLAIRAGNRDERIVRTILSVDEAQQTMTFAGDVPHGWRAQLMRANFDRLIEGAGEAALSAAVADADAGETLAIAISCFGRRLVLGERTEEELEATLQVLPSGALQVGFYSYGEISPFTTGGCDLHNQTMTLTTIGER